MSTLSFKHAASGAMSLPWPLPALAAWGVAWLSFWLAAALSLPAPAAALLALWLPAWMAWLSPSAARRLLLLAGFPLALLLQGQLRVAAVWWLAPLALLLLMYPLRAWRDAPVFPTAQKALCGLAQALASVGQPAILDAGSGLGHGLRALRAQWPHARLHGTEHSALLALLSAVWRRDALVKRGDMWADDWSAFDVVYLFQRPESMPRAWAKAQAEMRPGAWLVSLEFSVPGVQPDRTLHNPGQRAVLAWQIKGDGPEKRADRAATAPQCAVHAADMRTNHRSAVAR